MLQYFMKLQISHISSTEYQYEHFRYPHVLLAMNITDYFIDTACQIIYVMAQ